MPNLALFEMVNGSPQPVTTLDIPATNRGGVSVEKILRVYNNRGSGSASTDAIDCNLTIVDAAGGNDSILIHGTDPQFLPMMRGRCTTLCRAIIQELLGIGNSINLIFPMAEGGNNMYVQVNSADSMKVRLEKQAQTSPNATWEANMPTIVLSENYTQPFMEILPDGLPASFEVDGKTYYTENCTIDPSGGFITLDFSPGGPNSELPPATQQIFFLGFRYVITVDANWAVSAGQPIANLVFDGGFAPETDCRVWGSYNYLAAESEYEVFGGSSYTMDLGGKSIRTPSTGNSGDPIRDIPDAYDVGVDDAGYAEVVIRYEVPQNAPPTPNVAFKIKVSFSEGT